MVAIERACGVREPGGIYFEAGHCKKESARCAPVWDFLFDPPIPLGDMDLPNRGVLIVERPDGSGIHDVYDRIGENNYPNPADMIEEIRRFGMSRRAPRGLDFTLLGPGSQLFMVHNRAIVNESDALYDALITEYVDSPHHAHPYYCPCKRAGHKQLPYQGDAETRPMCVGLWWETILKGDPSYNPQLPLRTVTRELGSTVYQGRQAPHGLKLSYTPGLIAHFPIQQLAVVLGDDDEHLPALDRLTGTRLPVVEVDE